MLLLGFWAGICIWCFDEFSLFCSQCCCVGLCSCRLAAVRSKRVLKLISVAGKKSGEGSGKNKRAGIIQFGVGCKWKFRALLLLCRVGTCFRVPLVRSEHSGHTVA